MRPSISHYTTGIKSYHAGVKFDVKLPVCKYAPEGRACAPSSQLFYWDNAPVETRSLALTPRSNPTTSLLRCSCSRRRAQCQSPRYGRKVDLSLFCFRGAESNCLRFGFENDNLHARITTFPMIPPVIVVSLLYRR